MARAQDVALSLPTGVHDARNGRSGSPESVFTIPGIAVHDGPEYAFHERCDFVLAHDQISAVDETGSLRGNITTCLVPAMPG